MKTWYYAVRVIHWLVALLISHTLVGVAVYIISSPPPPSGVSPPVVASFLFAILGIAWYWGAIAPLSEFKREFGFWPGRTKEERRATSSAVFNTFQRRADIVSNLVDIHRSVPEGLAHNATLVDVEHAEARFNAAVHTAWFRYAEFGADRETRWQNWCQRTTSASRAEPEAPPPPDPATAADAA